MSFLTAQHGNRLWRARTLALGGLFASLAGATVFAQSKPSESPALSVPVLVSDFELFSVPVTPRPKTPPPATPEKPKSQVPLVYQDTDVPSTQARRLMDFFAMTLVQTLSKKGFKALRSSGANPPYGAQIRGVFAEPDALNRIRRALLGAGSPNARFFLYVGIFNLARQEQPLYMPATMQPSSTEYGPIITVNNYIPMAKYELDKNPTEEDVQKICNQIAASLMSLLEANPNAFSH